MPYSAGPSPESGSPKAGRVFYRWDECEEYLPHGGMWRVISGPALRQKMSDAAAKLMRNTSKFEAAMTRATHEWPKSCEMNLTAEGNNQRAWLGHAGCYLATGSPEECTRLGWHQLNPTQQRHANASADKVIAAWRRRYRPTPTVSGQLDMFGSDLA